MHKRFGYETEGILLDHYYLNGSYKDVTVMSLFKNNFDFKKTKIEVNEALLGKPEGDGGKPYGNGK